MASILFQGTHGSDDPTMAAMPFIGANGAIEAGHQASIVLIAEATVLMKDVIANAVTPVGFPPLKEHIAKAIENRIPIHIWGGWGRARGVTDQDLAGKNATFTNPVAYANTIVEHDRVVTY